MQNVSPRLQESRTECEYRRLGLLGLSAAFQAIYIRSTSTPSELPKHRTWLPFSMGTVMLVWPCLVMSRSAVRGFCVRLVLVQTSIRILEGSLVLCEGLWTYSSTSHYHNLANWLYKLRPWMTSLKGIQLHLYPPISIGLCANGPYRRYVRSHFKYGMGISFITVDMMWSSIRESVTSSSTDSTTDSVRKFCVW